MDADELRTLQAPLKERYRDDPDSAGVTLRAVATALGVQIRAGRVHAEGDLDFRGTLGVERQAPVGFRTIRVTFDLDTDAEPVTLDKLLELTERYCVVHQTIARSPAPSMEIASS